MGLQPMRVNGWNLNSKTFPDDTEYPGINDGENGSTAEVLECATSPLDLLLFILRRSLGVHIAKKGNPYFDQHLNERVHPMHQKQREQGKDVICEEVLEKEIKQNKSIKDQEIGRCIGLLTARMLCPHSRQLSDQWATTIVDAVLAESAFFFGQLGCQGGYRSRVEGGTSRGDHEADIFSRVLRAIMFARSTKQPSRHEAASTSCGSF
ncbi:hypothetical protein PPTG_17048 [Phytophthora nicotianae INRA-310]|uniref:Uncharacterized protein n=1 Tax=Phytophthora nicotianae (strain INRA-310) TaxID=761204 RepID=W2PNH7_PHYN3|nr:hypothetical protein PPTG_17048 [Phytophthora nicotianae INRA-310]ETN01590.1 hypothetical protein PPTG_17048 [Phytophthora nicotianae INRA-310]